MIMSRWYIISIIIDSKPISVYVLWLGCHEISTLCIKKLQPHKDDIVIVCKVNFYTHMTLNYYW